MLGSQQLKVAAIESKTMFFHLRRKPIPKPHNQASRGHYRRLFFLCILFGALLTAKGLAAELSADVKAELEVAAVLNAKYLRIREASVTNRPNPDLSDLLTLVGNDTNVPELPELVSFFMRGAVGFPLIFQGKYYLLFYNPVADVGVLTSWDLRQHPRIVQAKMAAGERFLYQPFEHKEPRWFGKEKMPETIISLSSDMLKMATEDSFGHKDLTLERIAHWERDLKRDELAIAVWRIGFTILGTSDELIPCGKKISSLGLSVYQLRRSAAFSNITIASAKAIYLLPVGGVTAEGLNIRFYANQLRPSDLVMLIADNREDCDIKFLNGFDTLPALNGD